MSVNENRPQSNHRPLVFLRPEQSENLDAFIILLKESGYPLHVLLKDEPNFDELISLQPSAIFLDCVSTASQGLEILKQLKGKALQHEVPVFFISDQDDEILAETALELGASEWIPFPVRKKEALLRLKKYLTPSSLLLKTSEKLPPLEEARLESLLAINEYQADSIQDLLDFTLNEIIALTESKIGYIYFYDEEKREFTLNTWSSEVMEECKILEPQTTYQLDGTGIWGEVVRQRKPIVVNNFQSPHTLKKGYPEGHIGLNRFLSIPVFDNNQIVAVVGVGNKETAYNQADIRQLSLMMNSVWAIVRKRKQERQLAESEKRFRIMYESAPLSYQSLDRNACLVDINQKWLDTLGYTRDEVIGRPFGDFMTPESAELIKNRFAHFVEAGEIHDYVFDMVRKDGTTITVSYDGNIGYDELGNFRQTHCIFSDISEKKKIEFALRESEARFRNFFEHSPVGKSITGIDGSMQVNPAFCQMLGYTQEELAMKKFAEITHPDDLDLSNDYIRRMVAGEITEAEFEKRYIQKSGNVVWTSVTTFLQRDENGKPLYFYSSVVDVTAKRMAENQLRENEERFRTTLFSIGDGVITTDAHGAIQMMNTIAEQMTGWSQAEAEGKMLEEVFRIVNEDTRRSVEIPVRTVLRDGSVVGLVNHTVLIGKDNTERPIADSAAPIRNEDNEITGVVLVFRDQTEERKAQNALRASEDRFRRIVESSPIGKYLYRLNENDELIFMRANPAADRIIGIDHRQLEGKTLNEAFPALAKTDVPELYVRVAKGELGTQRFEIKYAENQIDGYFEVTVFRIGEKTIAIDFVDVTERKKAQQKLIESEEKYRYLFDNNPQPMWIYDLETLAFLNVNEAATLKYGFSKVEFLAMTLEDIRPAGEIGRLHADVVTTTRIYNNAGIWKHRKKNGELIDVEIISHLIEYEGRSARLVLSNDVTERITAEQALRESEERFRTTLYSIGDGVITTDALGNVQMMNDIAEQLTGWSQAEAVGKLLEEVFPIINEDTRKTVEIPVRRVLREGVVVGLANHTMLIAKDGTERPIADSAAPIRSESSEIIGVVLVFRDQTHEREAERILQESEFFFRESQRAATIGSYNFNISTGIWTSSEVLDQIFGIDKDYPRDIDGWESLIYPDDLSMMDHHLSVEVIALKKTFNKEYRIIRKSDGALRWVHGLGQLMLDKNGTPVSMIGTIQDITKRKKSEEEIQYQNNRLNAIINAMPDLVFISDRNGTYLEFFNPKSAGMLYPPDKLINSKISDVFDRATAELHLQKIQECLDKRELVSYEYSGEKDGESIHFDGRIVPLDENRVLRFVRNITDSKKLEQEQFRLLNIIDHSLNEIYVFDSETLKFSYVNQGALKNLGYSLGEMKELTPVDIKPKFDWNTFVKSIEPLISGQKKKLAFETLHQRKDGTTYPVEVHLQLHRQGEKAVFFAVINDITSRKLSEALVRESEEMFRKLAESTPIAICIYQDDKWIYTNPAGEKLSGYSLKEHGGMYVWEFVAPEYQSMIKEFAKMRTEGSGSEKGYEFRIIRKNGESRWVYLRGSRINYKGRPAGLISVLDMTEKKKMEDELRQSEERFRKAITEAPFPIMIHADNEEVIAISRGWAEISGYSLNDIPTTSEWIRKAYGKQYSTVKTHIDKLYKIKHWIDEGEYPLKTKSGEERIWDFGSSPLGQLADGRRLVISMAKDITDRIRSAETIQNERTLLRTVIDNLPDPIYVKDNAGRKIMANKADLENIGAENEAEVIGKTDFELFDRHTAQRLWNDDQKVLKEGQLIINREEIFHEGKKNQRWLLTTKVPLRNQQGEVVGMVGIGRDITGQRMASETIQKLSKGIEQNPASIVITDLLGNIEYVNPKFSETTGYSAEEALGQNPRILKSGETPPELYKNLWKTITRGEVWRGEFNNRKKNGELYWEHATITSIKNDDGKITHYIAIKEDISQRKKMESDLIWAKEKAEESDRLKSAFLANMSHEIRTPLNSVIGFSELLADPDFNDHQKREFISHIIGNGNQLLNIISDILDISKIESGEIIIRKTELPLQKLLDEIRALHTHKIESKPLEFTIVFPEELQAKAILADKERLHQIFNNLISNALKFTSEGYIQVGCTTVGEMVEFYVKDTGIGILPKFHTQIFDRFRQVETPMTRKFGGNGLGLTITKNLVELMGGTIRLESEPGKGSTFFFTVPLLVHAKPRRN